MPALLTASGDVKNVSRRSYPLSGLDANQVRSPSSSAIPLSRLPSGETRMLAISRVYRTNPVIMACVHLLARGLSSVPVHTYRALADGERRRVRSDLPPDGPGRPTAGVALDALARQPAPRVSRRKLVFKSVIDLAIFGNSLQAFDWGDYGPTQLWPLPWRRTVVHTTDPMTVLWFDLWGATGRVSLEPERCVHLTWGDDPESAIGVSPIESLQYTIALHNAIDRHLVSYYGNQARPSGLLKVSQMPKGDQLEALREQFRQLYTAPEAAGNVIITSGEYQPIAEATGVPTLAELVRLSWQEIYGVYGIDPPMVGNYQQAVRANVREARAKFFRDTLGPWAVLHEDEWNAQMIWQNPAWAYHWWQFDLDAPLRPELGERAQIYAQMSEVWSVNEKRRRENLPDLEFPEADTVWVGSGKIPLGFGTPTTTSDLDPEPPDPALDLPALGTGSGDGDGDDPDNVEDLDDDDPDSDE